MKKPKRELKKIREWLYDYYSMFHEEHSAQQLFLKSVGEREVESFAEAHAHINNSIDLTIMWIQGIRPAPLNDATKDL